MAIELKDVKKGDKVYYQPKHYKPDGEFENGMVKEIIKNNFDCIRVVYNCAGEWSNYEHYTSALTNIKDLYLGWK